MKMSGVLSKILNVHHGEWPRLSLLYVMSLIGLTGLTWGDAIVQAGFLQRVGVQYLPWVIISSAACSVAALFIYTLFADRVSNTRLLVGLLAVSGAGMMLGLAALVLGFILPGYLLLFLVLQVPLLDIYNIHWPTYVNGFYDIRSAKRIVPVLGTADRVAGIIGGLSMPLMNRLFSPTAIVVGSVVTLAVMGALAAAMPRLLREPGAGRTIRAAPGRAADSTPSAGVERRVKSFARGYGSRLREGYSQVASSRFLRWMALSTFCVTILLPFVNYATSAILQSQLKTTVAISNYTGVLSGIANLVLLPVQLLLLSRFIARLGVGSAGLIFPFTSLATVGSLIVAPGLKSATVGYLNLTAFRTAFRVPVDDLLYNVVPQRVKARTRAFVGGLVVPFGAILGGLLLLTPLMQASWFLPAASLLVVAALILAAVMVRRHYGHALVALLEQEDFSSLALHTPSDLVTPALTADPATLARLARKLEESSSPERTLFIAQLATAVGGETALPLVRKAISAATDGRLRASLVDVLLVADLRKGGARDLCVELLSDPDPYVRLSAVGGLERIAGRHDQRYQEAAAGLLADPDIEIRLRVLPALLASDDLSRRSAGHAELRTLLRSADPHTRARAVRVIGRARAFGLLLELVRSLTDPDDEVRLAAALATEEISGDETVASGRDMLLAVALLLLHDPVERARIAAVTVLDRLGARGGASASAARASSVAGLADPSLDVRRRAVEALVRGGRRSIAPAREQLDAGDPAQRKMAAVALARIEPRKYGSLVLGTTLDTDLRTIYSNLACLRVLTGCGGPAVDVLASALRERNEALLEEIFYLLAAVREPAAVDTTLRSLRSPIAEVRANAVEALESLSAPQTAALIAPLLEPERPSGPTASLDDRDWGMSFPAPAAAFSWLLGDAQDSWQRILSAAALRELSRSQEAESDHEFVDLLELARSDPDAAVRAEADVGTEAHPEPGRGHGPEVSELTLVQKLIVLRKLPFFSAMPIEQLRILARVSEVESFPADVRLFKEGDAGGILYAVVIGRVGLEQEKRKGSFSRLATVEAGGYVGESDFLCGDYCSSAAIAIEKTLTLKLRREPVIALARQYPDLALELIGVLSDRLREAHERIAELTRTEPEKLHKLYDQFSMDPGAA